MSKYTWKRIVSLMLVLTMCVGFLAAVPAYAADAETSNGESLLADLGESADAELGDVKYSTQLGATIGWTNDALNQSTFKQLH